MWRRLTQRGDMHAQYERGDYVIVTVLRRGERRFRLDYGNDVIGVYTMLASAKRGAARHLYRRAR